MFTSKALNKHIHSFLTSLEQDGFHVHKAILFGSYASGKPKKNSDIDLAVWLLNNPEKHYSEIPVLLHIISSHHPIRPVFYDYNETKKTDPFIEIIERTGKQILLPLQTS